VHLRTPLKVVHKYPRQLAKQVFARAVWFRAHRHPSNAEIQFPALTTWLVPWIAALATLRPPIALAQMSPLYAPVNTTLVISKPALDQIYRNEPLVTFGVGTKQYKFILNDAYVDSTRIRWPDIWEQVRIFRPNFIVQGPFSNEIEHVEPGTTLTVKAMYAPLTRTFEIVFTQPGKGPFESKKHY